MMAMTPEKKQSYNAYQREYQRRRRAEDPEYLAMKRKSSTEATARRCAEDPEYRERRKASDRDRYARLKAERTNP